MNAATWISVLLAGCAAGIINGAVGSGTLLTFPVLLAVGLPPVVANGTNTLGMSAGSWASAWAYRQELRQRWHVLRYPMLAGFLGALAGALLVVSLPPSVFTAVIPWVVLTATALVALAPLLGRWLSHRGGEPMNLPKRIWPWTLGVGVYGGYFGGAQGIVLMAILGLRYDRDVQHCNAAKNMFAATANMTAAAVFLVTGRMNLAVALVLAAGAIVGGYAGGHWARQLPSAVLRTMVIIAGLVASGYLLIFG